MSNDKFKNAPIHDKKAIIEMMDELEPKDMIEVVELLKRKQQNPNKQQTAMQEMYDELIAHEWDIPMSLIVKCQELMEIERQQHKNTYLQSLKSNFQKFEHYWESTYQGDKS